MQTSDRSLHLQGNLYELDTPHKSALGSTNLALGLVSNVASGALSVPGLKPAAEIALQIFQVLKVVTRQLVQGLLLINYSLPT